MAPGEEAFVMEKDPRGYIPATLPIPLPGPRGAFFLRSSPSEPGGIPWGKDLKIVGPPMMEAQVFLTLTPVHTQSPANCSITSEFKWFHPMAQWLLCISLDTPVSRFPGVVCLETLIL